jgi:two-component system, NtrC family, response regulator HydG
MKQEETRDKILVVDDSIDMVELLRRHLEKAGFHVATAFAVPQAIEVLGSESIDLVVTDLKMPGISGLDLVRHVKDNFKDTEILLITGYPSVDGAVEAMKSGAADYLPKPFTSAELLAAVGRLLQKLHARRSMETSRAMAEQVPGMIGSSRPMLAVFQAIRVQAGETRPVLITGEHGTGRRSVARAIHLSAPPRSSARPPFVGLDPAVTLEGWLPKIEGTVYVHEVGLLPAAAQKELLRAIDAEGMRIRLIASTSSDLIAVAARGGFDSRLLERLSTARIALPLLTERGDDILHLIRRFAELAAREVGLAAPSFHDRVIETLRAYRWPGNVKELLWTVDRLIATAAGRTIEVPDLPQHMRFTVQGTGTPDRPLSAVEAAYIQEVLTSVGGNRTRAAEILGIDRKTLRHKMRRAATE